MAENSAASSFQRWFSYLVQAPLFGLSTAFCGAVSLACSLWDSSGRQQHSISRFWAWTLTGISGARVTVVHPERLRTGATAVYACNHLSYMDTPVLFSRLPFQFRILARHDLWKVPFIGWYLGRSGQIPVDTSSQRSTVASLTRGTATLTSGMSIVLFPDGGRSEDGSIQPFQKGAAYMAIRAQVPIIPMALLGTNKVLPMHVYHLTPHPVMLVVGEAIPTAGLTSRDADAVTARVFRAISEMYYQHHEGLENPAVSVQHHS